MLRKQMRYATLLVALPSVAACAPAKRIPETGEVSDVLAKLEQLTSYDKVAVAHLAMMKLSKEGRDGERAAALAQDLLSKGEYQLVDALEQIADDDLRAYYWGAVGEWAPWYPECRALLDRFLIRRAGRLTTELAIQGGSHPDTWGVLVDCALNTSEAGWTRVRAAYTLARHSPDQVFSRISALKEDRTSFGSPASKYGMSQVVAEEFEKIVAQRQKFGWGKPQ